jgi:hypothetical protein
VAAAALAAVAPAGLACGGAGALVYHWSPRWVLSVEAAPAFAAAAAEHGLAFVARADEAATVDDTQAALARLPASHPLRSAPAPPCTDAAGMPAHAAPRHYPAAEVVSGARVRAPAIVGAMPRTAASELIGLRLAQTAAFAPPPPPRAVHGAVLVPPSDAGADAVPLSSAAATASPPAAAACIPDVQYVELDLAATGADDHGEVPLGAYERISPDGRFVLRSFSGRRLGDVSLVEFVGHQGDLRIRLHETGLANEAFPVQGSWRYLADPSGRHFRFTDVLRLGRRAEPLFEGGMTGFYAAAAELPGERAGELRIRSLSWPNAEALEQQGRGALQVRTLTVQDDGRRARIVADSGAQFLCRERQAVDGPFYGLPMLGVDGREFSAVPQHPRDGDVRMRIYALGETGRGCEARASLDFESGKATFGYAAADGQADLVFEYRGQVWWLERASGLEFNLADWRREALASAFPGLTRDGRVVYAAQWKVPRTAGATCGAFALPEPQCRKAAGYVIVDPYQSAAYRNHLAESGRRAARACITQAEVDAAEAAFARLHPGLGR